MVIIFIDGSKPRMEKVVLLLKMDGSHMWTLNKTANVYAAKLDALW